MQALSIPLNEGHLLFLQQLDFLPSLSSLLTTLLNQTIISQSFLSFLLHFFLLLSHKLTSLSTYSSSSLSFSRSFSAESLPTTSLSSSLSVMITQLSTLLFEFLKDLSSKHPSLITPSIVSLLTSTLLVLLPRPVVNPTAWLQVTHCSHSSPSFSSLPSKMLIQKLKPASSPPLPFSFLKLGRSIQQPKNRH